MKLSLLVTTILMLGLTTLSSCNSSSSSTGSSSGSTTGVSPVSPQETKKDETVEIPQPTESKVTAVEICKMAFSYEKNDYFKSENDYTSFQRFLRQIGLKNEISSCDSFETNSIKVPNDNLDLILYDNTYRWINIFLPHFDNITNLSLNDNGLSSLDGILNLRKIDTLFLDGTSISDLSSITHLTNLSSLSLENTKITNESLKDLPKFSTYFSGLLLFLGNNPQLTDISELANHRVGLKSLDLNGNNHISDYGPIASLSSLSSLNLSKTNVGDADLQEINFSKVQFISNLDLSDTDISDINGLKKLVKLEKLNLMNTQVTNFEALSKMTTLKYLYLSAKQIDTLDLSSLPKGVQVQVLRK